MRWRAWVVVAIAITLGTGTAISALPTTAAVARRGAEPLARMTSAARPPIPRVSTLGVTRSATLVSYCWTRHLPGGTNAGACADGQPGAPANTIRWRPGVKVRLDLRLPAHGVQIQAARFSSAGSRPSRLVQLKITRIDPSGRRWMFRLPRRAKHATDLLISARFANGDIEAELGLRRA
jgi:hypothetical protein